MDDKDAKKDALQMPSGATPAKEPEIHVIPERFYGAALKKKVVKALPEKEAAAGAAKPAVPGVTPAKPAGGKKVVLVVAIVLAVVLIGGLAAWLLLGRGSAPVPTGPQCGDAACEEGETIASCPADCRPKGPVCGDAKCETGESFQNCAVDCPAPAPVCGDDACDAEETPESCPADCEPPAPVCGDDACEEGETAEACPADCAPPEPVPGADSDSDGLTDLEERSIYQTNPRLVNSDGDSFVDLNEVLNLFDPNDPDPQPLDKNPGIAVFTDPTLGYEMFRPTAWTVGVGAAGTTVFNAPTGEQIEVLVDEIADGDTLESWYRTLDPAATSDAVRVVRTKRGYEYIISPSRSAIFIRADQRVFVISYKLNGAEQIQYRVTFEMMANSFRLSPTQ